MIHAVPLLKFLRKINFKGGSAISIPIIYWPLLMIPPGQLCLGSIDRDMFLYLYQSLCNSIQSLSISSILIVFLPHLCCVCTSAFEDKQSKTRKTDQKLCPGYCIKFHTFVSSTPHSAYERPLQLEFSPWLMLGLQILLGLWILLLEEGYFSRSCLLFLFDVNYETIWNSVSGKNSFYSLVKFGVTGNYAFVILGQGSASISWT